MRILIVEDNPTDRDLLRYLLESRFQNEAKFREANSLETAFRYLDGRNIDCVILDLQLPDSTGRETFEKLNARYPDVPVIVMTHNKDRGLALDMIKAGAADYILKDYTNEEDIFRRIIFAVEKHSRTLRVDQTKAASVHALERAQATMLTAHQSGETVAVQASTVATTSAVAEISKHLFLEMQQLSQQLKERKTKDETTNKILETLQAELLGTSSQLSIRSRLEGLEHRVANVEGGSVQPKLRSGNPTKLSYAKLQQLGLIALVLAVVAFLVWQMVHVGP